MNYSKVRLYVKSVQTVTGRDELEHRLGSRGPTFSYVTYVPRREWVLSEDQERIVEMVRSIASKYGLEVEVVDVGRENVINRVLQEEKERIRAFPTLVAGSEQTLEGDIKEEEVESLFFQIAETNRKKYV